MQKNDNVIFDYLVLDDGSTDGTSEMLAGMLMGTESRLEVLHSENMFWNRGMHMVIEHAKKNYPNYDYYMLMNDDTRFDEHVFDEMIFDLKSDEVLVGAIRGEDGHLSYGGIKYTRGIKYLKLGPEELKAEEEKAKAEGRKPEYTRNMSFDTFNANCAIIPNKIFMKASIDPYYQHSIGDFDYGLSIHKMGYAIRLYKDYVGECNDNSLRKTWQDETLPLRERIRLKESRKGLPTKDWFHFLKKNWGLGTAIVKSITPWIRLLFGFKTRYAGKENVKIDHSDKNQY